jgi:hypothetical protein
VMARARRVGEQFWTPNSRTAMEAESRATEV